MERQPYTWYACCCCFSRSEESRLFVLRWHKRMSDFLDFTALLSASFFGHLLHSEFQTKKTV